jgi:hypothetical protein
MKIQGSMGKTKFFFGTLPISSWAILVVQLLMDACQKYRKNESTTHFEQKFATCSYGVGI